MKKERPCQVTICKSRFGTTGHLNVHFCQFMKKNKPLKCGICYKMFSVNRA